MPPGVSSLIATSYKTRALFSGRLDISMLLVVLGCLICNICSFNFYMPLAILNGDITDPTPMADMAEQGDLLRQVSLVAFALIGLAVVHRSRAGWPRPVGWLGAAALTMLAWNCLSYAWADSPDIVGRRVAALLVASVGAYGLSCLEARQLRLLLTVLALQNVLVGLGNELLLGTFRPFSEGYRFAGMFHPNFQAWNDAVLALLALSYFPERDLPAAVKFALLSTGLFFLLLTNSRTSMICLTVAAGFWYGMRAAARGLPGSRVAFIAVGFAASVLVVLHGSGLAALGDMAQALLGTQRDAGNIESLTGRLDVWDACLRVAADRWPFGFGYGGFWTSDRIFQISGEVQWGMNQAHSAYLDVILSTGVVGLGLHVVTTFGGLFVATQRFWRSRSEGALLWATILAFSIVHGMTESTAISPVMTSGTLLMIMTAKLAFAPQRRGAG